MRTIARIAALAVSLTACTNSPSPATTSSSRAALDGSDGGGFTDVTSYATVDDMCSAYRASFCAAAVACDVFRTEDGCRTWIAGYCPISQWEVDQGWITFDGVAAYDCVASFYTAPSCTCDYPSAACSAMTTGQVPLGGACHQNRECVVGNHCAGLTCPGTCEAGDPPDDNCNVPAPHGDTGAACVVGKTNGIDVNHVCYEDSYCRLDDASPVGSSGIGDCQPKGTAVAAACWGPNGCTTGLRCFGWSSTGTPPVYGTCQAPLADGSGPCKFASDCNAPSSYCDLLGTKKCAPAATAGGACTRAYACHTEQRYTCTGGTCVPLDCWMPR
jgi:hypothetical protein